MQKDMEKVADDYVLRAQLLELLKTAMAILEKVEKNLEDLE